MARFDERRLTCPHCQHQAVQRVALSIDAEHGAAQIAQIMDGTFQRFACASCGKSYRADGPLMYVDFDEKRWVSVFPEPDEARWWKLEREPTLAFEQNMLEHAPPVVRAWAPGFEIRAVFGLEKLREKLVAWGAKIDDRLLEAYKLALLRSMGPYPLGPAARPRLRAVRADGTLEFEVPRFAEGEPMRLAKVAIDRRELDRVAANREEWAPVIEAVSSGPYVDLGRLLLPRGDGEDQAKGAGAPDPVA
jgi:hypothetical protein